MQELLFLFSLPSFLSKLKDFIELMVRQEGKMMGFSKPVAFEVKTSCRADRKEEMETEGFHITAFRQSYGHVVSRVWL